MSEDVLKQEYIVTNPHTKDATLDSISSELSSKIFADLINAEKYGIKIVVTMQTIEGPADE